MSDQGRWFKVWTSILEDPDFQELSLEDMGRWALLGAMTKLVGEHGVLVIHGTGKRLCEVLQVASLDAAHEVLVRLPHVRVIRGEIRDDTMCENRHGTFTVTFQNWVKYQEDSTQAQRASASRSKKRRDEKRRDEKRTPPLTPPGDRPDDLSITRSGSAGSDGALPPNLEALGAILQRMRAELPQAPAG